MNAQPSVFITGTSSGIGLASAREMKQRGWRVFASARNAADLASLRKEGFEAIDMDMADPESVEAGAKQVLEASEGILQGLVNNAGYGQPGALEDLDVEAMRQQFAVNVIGLQQLSNLVLPGMIQNRQGRIVHVSSVVGRIALPFMGIYSASKFAVEALADAQRVELYGTGVKISLVEPGPINTRFSKNAMKKSGGAFSAPDSRFADLYEKEIKNRKVQNSNKAFSLPPEAVAKKIAHALCAPRPHRRYHVTLPAQLGALMSRLAPDALLDWILSGELKRRSGG